MGSIPGQETKIPNAMVCGPLKKHNKEMLQTTLYTHKFNNLDETNLKNTDYHNLHSMNRSFCFMFFSLSFSFFACLACRILVPQLGTEPKLST